MQLPHQSDERADPAFAFEMFLQEYLDMRQHQVPGAASPAGVVRRHVTSGWLLDAYRPDLVRDHVDIAASDAQWAEVLTADARPFVALTSDGCLRTLVRRDALVATLVVRLVEGANSARKE